MPTSIIAAALVSTFAIGTTAAGYIASATVFAIGVGISLLSSLLNKPRQPKPSDGQVTIRQSAAPRFRSYGRVKVGGNLMFVNTTAGFYGRIFAMGSGRIDAVEEHWLDDHLVTLSGEQVTSAPYVVDGASRAFINFRLGEDNPAVYAATHASFPDLWTTDHLGRGVPSAEIVLQQTPSKNFTDVFPSGGDTKYRQVQRGALVPNVDATGFVPSSWSDNAARIILDYLIHPDGLGLDPSWISNALPSWNEAIAACSEAVPLAAGGVESRYRIGNTYLFSERPADVLTRYLQSCDAVIYPTPGQGLAIRVGKWAAPTVTIDDDAILAFTGFGRGRDVLTTANTIRAQYTEPSKDYQETDAEAWVDTADVAERGEIATDLEFFCAPSHSQCRRLMKIAAWRANPNWVGTITCNLRALPVMGERFVNVVISELGVNETFEVLSTQLLIDRTILTGIEIQMQSFSAGAYDWTTGEEGSIPAATRAVPRIAPERDLPMLVGFTATANGVYAVLHWTAFADDYLTADVEYRIVNETQWSAWPVADGANAARVGPLVLGTRYEFRARTRSELTDRVAGWTASQYITIGTEDWVLVADGLAATVDLDFADDLYFQRDKGSTLAALVTVTRASSGYATAFDDSWISFGPHAARRTDRGLLVEEARTNVIRNNAMIGAIAGSPGTLPTNWTSTNSGGAELTLSIVGSGVDSGVDYIDFRLVGTATAARQVQIRPEGTNGVAALPAQVWSLSFLTKIVSGGLTNIGVVNIRGEALNAGLTSIGIPISGNVVPTAQLRRFGVAGTAPANTAFVRPIFLVNTGIGAFDLTWRIGWPQLELGASPLSPIRTAGAATTRAADIVTLTAPPSLGPAVTIHAKSGANIAFADQALVSVNDGTVANVWSARRTGGNAAALLTAAGTSATLTGAAMSINGGQALAVAYAIGDQALSFAGGAIVAGTSALAPAGLNAVTIGHGAGGAAPFQGYVQRVAIWPATRISNAALQALTA